MTKKRCYAYVRKHKNCLIVTGDEDIIDELEEMLWMDNAHRGGEEK